MAKAIVIVGNDSGPVDLAPSAIQHTVLASVDVLGTSVVRRTVERLLRDGIESIAICCSSSVESEGFEEHPSLTILTAADPWEAAVAELARYEDRLDCVLIMRIGAYVEFDLGDAVRFFGEHSDNVVRGFDDEGPLDLWMIRPEVIDNANLFSRLQLGKSTYYPVRGYINRLRHPRDLRRLVVDSFNSRCRLRPQGSEVRHGIWMCDGAQVEKSARIVSPSFIGRDVTISEQCLVTRYSNIERDSYVDYGTVVEDTTILPNSYVGIGLDLAHSVVDGRSLVNLHHGVMLKIGDPVVMRQNKPLAGVVRSLWSGSGVDGQITAGRNQNAD